MASRSVPLHELEWVVYCQILCLDLFIEHIYLHGVKKQWYIMMEKEWAQVVVCAYHQDLQKKVQGISELH